MVFNNPLYDPHVSAVLADCARCFRDGHGSITFVAGAPGSGRTSCLRQLFIQASDLGPRPRVHGFGTTSSSMFDWDPPARSHDGRDAAIALLGLLGESVPILGLLQAVAAASTAAARFVLGSGAVKSTGPVDLMLDVLRVAAHQRPVVCIVDDADVARGRWWSELLLGLALEINRELPLFLVLGVEGGPDAGDHTNAETDALFSARELLPDLARWRYLAPVAEPSLSALTGPADAAVLRLLSELSAGHVGVASALWDELRATQSVERDSDLDPWRLTPKVYTGSTTVSSVLRKRVRGALGSDDPEELDFVWRLLSYGALEGSEFTAQVLAKATGHPLEHVVGVLDGQTGREGDAPIVEPVTPALAEEASTSGKSPDLLRYRFVTGAFRAALLHYGVVAREPVAARCAVARALEEIFADEPGRVNDRIARLYMAAGQDEVAAQYRRATRRDMPVEAQINEAYRFGPALPPNATRAYVANALDILLDASHECQVAARLEEGGDLAARAALWAHEHGFKRSLATALKLQGAIEGDVGEPGAAKEHLSQARRLSAEIGDDGLRAEILRHLAIVEARSGDWAAAHDDAVEAVGIWRKLKNPRGLARIELLRANWYIQAREELPARRCVQIVSEHISELTMKEQGQFMETCGNFHLFITGRNDHAADAFVKAAATFTVAGERRLELNARRETAFALSAGGLHDQALEWAEPVLAEAISLGDVYLAASTHFVLGRIAEKTNRQDDAHCHYAEASRQLRLVGASADAERIDGMRRALPPQD